MYSGSGSGPLLAAAAAWDGLATELDSAAAAYVDLIHRPDRRTMEGPSASSMQTAAIPQVAWLRSAAGQADQAATQAAAAASAYEAAFSETVPPPVIAANRALLMELLATNSRPEHRGNCGYRGAVRRDVGSRRGRDVRLCRCVGHRVDVAAAPTCGAHDQPRGARRPGRCGGASDRQQRGYQYAGAQRGAPNVVVTGRVDE